MRRPLPRKRRPLDPQGSGGLPRVRLKLAPPAPLAPVRRRLEPIIPAAVPEPRDDARDAARWRALMSSERIRVSTTVHQPHSNPVPGSLYMMVELWSHSDMPETRLSRHLLVEYADFIREVNDDDVTKGKTK
jgi:hypothetical protein